LLPFIDLMHTISHVSAFNNLSSPSAFDFKCIHNRQYNSKQPKFDFFPCHWSFET
jgi:hypothetical protein